MTHFDELRLMSLEQMAELITTIKVVAVEQVINNLGFNYKTSKETKTKAFEEIKQYLKSEVSDNGKENQQ